MNATPRVPAHTDGAYYPAAPETSFFAVVHAQRACREFSDRPVVDDVVARVLDAAV